MKQAKGIVLLYCIYTGAFVGTALLRRCWPPASVAAGKVDVIMKNNRFPTGKRFASLEDAVLELVGHSKP